MKYIPLLILFLSIIGCKSQNEKIKSNLAINWLSKADNVENEITTKNLTSTIKNCNCEPVEYSKSYSTDLVFENSKYAKAKNEEQFDMWSKDSLMNDVKSIRFSGYDTIPNRYKIFANVERLSIENYNGIYGLDIFPKLRSVHFFSSVINLNTNENWLSQLEILIGQKTKFVGLESFQKTPNLKVIHMGFSGFEKFPTDLYKLDCLYSLTLGAYMFGEIDLTQLDLKEMRCLKFAEFHSWKENLKGIPSGIEKIETIKISHPNLTEGEKEKLKKSRG